MTNQHNKLIDDLKQLLAMLKLSVCLEQFQSIAERCEKEKLSYIEFLHELVLRENEQRQQKRIASLIKNAQLPRNKLLSDFDMTRIPGLAPSLVLSLASGDFIDRYGNVLIFGNPGTGKSHLAMALAREWCLLGRKVRFYTAANLVQLLLQAKIKMQLSQLIKQLDRFDVLIIDDISYVPFEKSETDVLFTLLSERYEMRSLLITSNLSFSQWDGIFKDSMTTSAAIDRLVHHATILELNASSYRTDCAKNKLNKIVKSTLKNTNKEEASMA
jgi:DNA replication protein DnaC